MAKQQLEQHVTKDYRHTYVTCPLCGQNVLLRPNFQAKKMELIPHHYPADFIVTEAEPPL